MLGAHGQDQGQGQVQGHG